MLQMGFLIKIEPQLLEIDYIDTTIGKARVFVFLLKSKLPQAPFSYMLSYMTERRDNTC